MSGDIRVDAMRYSIDNGSSVSRGDDSRKGLVSSKKIEPIDKQRFTKTRMFKRAMVITGLVLAAIATVTTLALAPHAALASLGIALVFKVDIPLVALTIAAWSALKVRDSNIRQGLDSLVSGYLGSASNADLKKALRSMGKVGAECGGPLLIKMMERYLNNDAIDSDFIGAWEAAYEPHYKDSDNKKALQRVLKKEVRDPAVISPSRFLVNEWTTHLSVDSAHVKFHPKPELLCGSDPRRELLGRWFEHNMLNSEVTAKLAEIPATDISHFPIDSALVTRWRELQPPVAEVPGEADISEMDEAKFTHLYLMVECDPGKFKEMQGQVTHPMRLMSISEEAFNHWQAVEETRLPHFGELDEFGKAGAIREYVSQRGEALGNIDNGLLLKNANIRKAWGMLHKGAGVNRSVIADSINRGDAPGAVEDVVESITDLQLLKHQLERNHALEEKYEGKCKEFLMRRLLAIKIMNRPQYAILMKAITREGVKFLSNPQLIVDWLSYNQGKVFKGEESREAYRIYAQLYPKELKGELKRGCMNRVDGEEVRTKTFGAGFTRSTFEDRVIVFPQADGGEAAYAKLDESYRKALKPYFRGDQLDEMVKDAMALTGLVSTANGDHFIAKTFSAENGFRRVPLNTVNHSQKFHLHTLDPRTSPTMEVRAKYNLIFERNDLSMSLGTVEGVSYFNLKSKRVTTEWRVVSSHEEPKPIV